MKLRQFNPWLMADAVRSVIESIEAVPATIEGNRQMLAWMRGERSWYDESEKRQRAVKVIDFANISDNSFYVTWEWTLEPPARKGNRADVLFLVNGLPVCVVEHKNPRDGGAIERAVKQLRRYEIETPELLGAPQLFDVTHLLDYWYGVTRNASRRDMARWKQTPEETVTITCGFSGGLTQQHGCLMRRRGESDRRPVWVCRPVGHAGWPGRAGRWSSRCTA